MRTFIGIAIDHPGLGRTGRGARACSETIKSSASNTKFATIELPRLER